MAGDLRRIRQILINLLGNAVKFTSEGTVILRVQMAEGGGHIEFSVEDTGPGIPPELEPLLFKPFTQGDSSFRRKFQGTGLGLAISQRLAGLMGGSVSFATSPGKGSVFTLRLPLRPGPADPGSAMASAGTIRPDVSSRPVLVVEDDHVNSVLARKMLDVLGYRTEFAETGKRALDAFAPNKFCAILMDIRMPDMDGIEVTRRIRALESGARVPIIALTANVMPGDRERFLAAGMDKFLPKPFKKDELAAILRDVAIIS